MLISGKKEIICVEFYWNQSEQFANSWFTLHILFNVTASYAHGHQWHRSQRKSTVSEQLLLSHSNPRAPRRI